MNYQTILTNLYFLFIHAEGMVNETEVQFGNQMIAMEGLNKKEFGIQLKQLALARRADVYLESLSHLKTLDLEKQIRCIAWLCAIANCDGFMDRAEWKFIYHIYHNELQLSLDDILAKQKQLNITTNTYTSRALLLTF